MMKRGIALLITVSMIAVITAIVLTTVNLLNSSLDQAKTLKELTQNQLVLKSLTKSLQTLSLKIESPEALEMLFIPFSGLSDDSGTFVLDFAVQPLQGKININALIEKDGKTISEAYKEILYDIFNAYHIQSPDQLINLIADTIDENTEERSVQSEQILLKSDFSNGILTDISQLKELGEIYAQQLKDPEVAKIVWEDLFYVEAPEFNSIDCNYLSEELAFYFGFTDDPYEKEEPFSCEMLPSDQNETIHRYNIKAFNKDEPYAVAIEAHYEIEGQKGGFKAHFDLDKQRISHIKTKRGF